MMEIVGTVLLILPLALGAGVFIYLRRRQERS